MGKRAAVGATMAASVIFAALLISNAVLVAASAQALGNASLVDGESALYASAQVLGGVASIELLGKAQSLLSSGPFECGNALPTVYARLDGLVLSLGGGGTRVNATVTQVPAGEAPDNFTIVKPYNGGLPGDLNLKILLASSGTYSGGRVSYHMAESHTLHLPVDLSTAVSFCLSAVTEVTTSLAQVVRGNCSASAVENLFGRVSARLSAAAASEGLGFSLRYALDESECSASFVVLVAQAGLTGPLGLFSWTVEEQGFVALQGPAGQGQA